MLSNAAMYTALYKHNLSKLVGIVCRFHCTIMDGEGSIQQVAQFLS